MSQKLGKNRRAKQIWNYFTKSGETAKCSLCKNILKISQRSITGLKYHLKSKHSIDLAIFRTVVPEEEPSTSKTESLSTVDCQRDVEEPINKIAKKRLPDNTLIKHSIELMISRMVAIDGISFTTLTTSEDLKYLFLKSGFNLPSSPYAIESIVENFSSTVRGEIIKKLQHLKISGNKFSLTINKWRSVKNKRYFNLHVHHLGTYFNLGVIRIRGSYSAQHRVELVETRLGAFYLYLDTDIVGITTDDESFINNAGELMNCYQQLCFAQGIQLAVIDVLYKNTLSGNNVPSQNDEAPAVYCSDNDDSSDDQTSKEQLFSFDHLSLEQPSAELTMNYKDLIEKVRKVVNYFKKSSTNNACLQKYIQKDFSNNELDLILDCKAKWSSLCNMLESFNVLKDCISRALIDVRSDIIISKEEWVSIEELLLCLQPVKLAVEVLCRKDSNLLTAETTLRFILEKLDQQQSDLSGDLAIALRLMIKMRRTDLSGLVLYLHNPKKYENLLKNHDGTFSVPKKNYIRLEIKKICERMLNLNETREVHPNISEIKTCMEIEKMPSQVNLSLNEELEMELMKERSDTYKEHVSSRNLDIEKMIKAEMSDYENRGIKGEYLSLIHNYINTITPTSVEAERAFFITDEINSIKNNLADKTIDTINFLRFYFLKNNM